MVVVSLGVLKCNVAWHGQVGHIFEQYMPKSLTVHVSNENKSSYGKLTKKGGKATNGNCTFFLPKNAVGEMIPVLLATIIAIPDSK